MLAAIVLAVLVGGHRDFKPTPTPIPIKGHQHFDASLGTPRFKIYPQADRMPKGTFDLNGIDPHGGPYKEIDTLNDLTQLPFVRFNSDRTLTVGIVYKAPVNGMCGVMANKDHAPDASNEGSPLYFGTFHVHEGEYHLAVGSVDGLADHEVHHYYVFYIACLRVYTNGKEDKYLPHPIVSKRYLLEVEPNV